MIDLDAYRHRLVERRSAALTWDVEQAYSAAIDILDEMRAEALPEVDAPSLPKMNRTSTTQTMRERALPRSGSMRRKIIDAVRLEPATDDRLEVLLDRPHQSISAARHGLVQQGWLEPATWDNGTPQEQRTRAGNPAQVWRLSSAAVRRLAQERPGGMERLAQ